MIRRTMKKAIVCNEKNPITYKDVKYWYEGNQLSMYVKNRKGEDILYWQTFPCKIVDLIVQYDFVVVVVEGEIHTISIFKSKKRKGGFEPVHNLYLGMRPYNIRFSDDSYDLLYDIYINGVKMGCHFFTYQRHWEEMYKGKREKPTCF